MPSPGNDSTGSISAPFPTLVGTHIVTDTKLTAEVSVDGKIIGTTPLVKYALAAGSHRIKLRNDEIDPRHSPLDAFGDRQKLRTHRFSGQNLIGRDSQKSIFHFLSLPERFDDSLHRIVEGYGEAGRFLVADDRRERGRHADQFPLQVQECAAACAQKAWEGFSNPCLLHEWFSVSRLLGAGVHWQSVRHRLRPGWA